MAGKTGKRILIITGQKPIAPVRTASGGQATLYEVYATTADGEPVEEPLRSFAELEEGIPIEYNVEQYNHPKHGTSYTLTPPPRNTAKRVRDLEEKVGMLMVWAETQGFDAKKARRMLLESEGPSEPIPAPENPDLDAKFGPDPPWSDEDLDRPPAEVAAESAPEPKDMEL